MGSFRRFDIHLRASSILLSFFALIIGTTLEAGSAVVDRADFKTIHLHTVTEKYLGKETKIDLIKLDPNFARIDTGAKNVFENAPVWIRFTVANSTNKEIPAVLLHNVALTKEIQVYSLVQEKHEELARIGNGLAYGERSIDFRKPAIAVTLLPGDNRFLIRADTDGLGSINFDLMPPSAFMKYMSDDIFMTSFAIGIIIFSFCFNLFFYLQLKYHYYVYYLVYSVAMLACHAILTGTFPQYLMPGLSNNGLLAFLNVFAAGIAVTLSFPFSFEFLQTKKHTPRLHKVLMYLYVLSVAATAAGFIEYLLTGSAPFTAVPIALVSQISFPMIIVASVACVFKGYKPARYFLLAWLTIASVTFAQNLYLFGVFDWVDSADLWALFGVSAEVSLLTLGLANKVRVKDEQQSNELARVNSELKDHVENLDSLVKEKTQDIRSILDNINSGIFELGDASNLEIGRNRSKCLDEILGLEYIQGPLTLESILLDRAHLGEDQKSQIKTVIGSLINESQLSFEVNSSILPLEVSIEIFGTTRTIELDWSYALAPDQSTITKILVACKDVTELRKYQMESRLQAQSMAKLIELVSVEQRKFTQFCETTQKFLQENQNLCNSKSLKDKSKILRMIFTNYHTIKGNARALGFKEIASAVHSAETHVAEMQQNDQPVDVPLLLSDVQAIRSIFDEYIAISREKLGRLDESGEKISLTRTAVTILAEKIVSEQPLAAQDVLPLLGAAYVPGIELVTDCERYLPRLAKDLGKAVPIVHATGFDGTYFTQDAANAMSGAFVHLMRNSMDHGIEPVEERQKKGKRGEGSLICAGEIVGDSFVIRLYDDGRGMAIARIREKGLQKGLLQTGMNFTNRDVAELIFESGLSTTSSVSEISGRGVGMAAVRDFIQELGGRMEIEIGEEQSDFVPFKFAISIPMKHMRLYPSTATNRRNLELVSSKG